MAETTLQGSDGSRNHPNQVFLTEVARAVTSPKKYRESSADQKQDDLRRETEARGGDEDATRTVFGIIDRIGERQQHSKNVRSLIQRAAQKTILVVRAKNATQAAENVTIRFHSDRLTDMPRCVPLTQLSIRVVGNLQDITDMTRRQLRETFAKSPEVEALLKDMFWYLTAHCFQSGSHAELENCFYQRIADTFTALFVRLQVQPSRAPHRNNWHFLDVFPDVMAQIVYLALFEAFPKSRKRMANTELQRTVLTTAYGWFVGFVPSNLQWTHWLSVDQDAPKRIAALADFPAMRNRMLRSERVERTKLEVKHRRGAAMLEGEDGDEQGQGQDQELDREQDPGSNKIDSSLETLPPLPGSRLEYDASHQSEVLVCERRVYALQNSPLVQAFLARHNMETNALHLSVLLRLSTGTHPERQNQGALHATTVPSERHRKLIPAHTYVETLEQVEEFATILRKTYSVEKQQMRGQNEASERKTVSDIEMLDAEFRDLRQNRSKLREYSNGLVNRSLRYPVRSSMADLPFQSVVPHPPPR